MSETFNTDAMLDELTSQLQSLLKQRQIKNPLMVGIHTGGVWVAQQLHKRLKLSEKLGTLNITFYRDDFTRIGMHPMVEPSNLPVAVEDRHIILVDDVLHTGRTIRAALNEIFDYGRPASVILAVLATRSGKELPISADISAREFDLEKHQHIKVTGPEPLCLTIEETV